VEKKNQQKIKETNINQIIELRKEKIKYLLSIGINPYPSKCFITNNNDEINKKFDSLEKGQQSELKIKVAGRVISYRNMGKVVFLDIKDGYSKIQIYINSNKIGKNMYDVFKRTVDISDIISIEGIPFKTKTNELSIMAENWTMLTKSFRSIPEKWHGLKDIETRYRKRYLDLIANNYVKNIFIKRNMIISSIRFELEKLNFIEVETPVLQPIAGGANAKPFITHHNVLNLDLFLRIAPELFLKKLIVGGMDKIFEIGKNFRNEGIDRRHNPEFTMLDLYQTYADYNDMIDITKNLIKSAAKKINCDIQLDFKKEKVYDLLKKYANIDLFEFINNVKDIKYILNQTKHLKLKFDNDITSKQIFDRLFDEFIIPNLKHPTFVIDYPSIYSPLSKVKFDQPDIAERFELYINGFEIANAYSELNDPELQKKNFMQQIELKNNNNRCFYDDDFIFALEHGLPPTGGLGIGIDRLVMILTKNDSIREVITFPSMKPE
jgi:lysyl-tRNA synthetase class 2